MSDPMKNTPSQLAMLKSILDNPRPRLSEAEFKARYLPIIANINGRYREIETYIANVAKHYDAEVELVDERGEVVAIVPPIRTPYPTEIGYKNSDSVVALVDQVEHTRVLSPVAAERLLNEMLPARHKHQMSAEVVKAYMYQMYKRWDDLFERYELPPRFFKKVEGGSTASTTPVAVEQGFTDDEIEPL